MKKSVIVLAAASLGMLASCGNKATVKNGEAYGLVHGAGYVGAATVKVEGDKITDATLMEYCLPTYITPEAASDDTVAVEVTSHGETSTKNFYKEVKFGSYTLTFNAEQKTYLSGTTTMVAFFQSEEACKAYAAAVAANEVSVTIAGAAKKDIMTHAALSKDENGYGGAKFDWKKNRNATVEAFKSLGEDLLKAAKKTEGDDLKNWYVGDTNTGATWTDLNTTKENSTSYAQLLVNALKAAK